MKTFVYFLLIVLSIPLHGQNENGEEKSDFQNEAFLHAVDAISPYTLKKGEVIYAQSLQTLPFPSWAFIGITERLTAQIDLLPWIYGVFSDFRKPIPSLNFRYLFNEQNGMIPTIGIETMFVHFWDTLTRFDSESIFVNQKGSYFHFKPTISYRFHSWTANISCGVEYTGELFFRSKKGKLLQKSYTKHWSPNFSFGLDYRPSKWISYHLAYSYGSTLTYLENVPHKSQFNYGFRIAPFYKNKYSFLRNLRVELVAINAYFHSVNTWQTFPLPVYPVFYWQWEIHRKKKSHRIVK